MGCAGSRISKSDAPRHSGESAPRARPCRRAPWRDHLLHVRGLLRRGAPSSSRGTDSRPSTPPSRPMPDCLKPPNAMLKSVRKRVVPDRARAQLARGGVGALDVVREHRGVEPVDRVVGDLDRRRLALGRDHGQHRPEDLLARDRRVVVDVAEHGRLDEVAARRGPWAACRRWRASRPRPCPSRCSPRRDRAGGSSRAGPCPCLGS